MSTFRKNLKSKKLDAIPEVCEPHNLASTKSTTPVKSTKTSRIREKLCHEKIMSTDLEKSIVPTLSTKKNKMKKKLEQKIQEQELPVSPPTVEENTSVSQSLGLGEGDVGSEKNDELESVIEIPKDIDEDSVSKISQPEITQIQELKIHGGLVSRCRKRIAKLNDANNIDLLAINRLENQIEKTRVQYHCRLGMEINKFEKIEKVFEDMAKRRAELEERNKFLEEEIKKVENEIQLKMEEFDMQKNKLNDEIQKAAGSFVKLYKVTSEVYRNTVDLANCFANVFNEKIHW